MTYVGQENRQHALGHIVLWDLKEPVMPWCSDGPDEAELGLGIPAPWSTQWNEVAATARSKLSCGSGACSNVPGMVSTSLLTAAARWATMFWSGSTATTRAPAATSLPVAIIAFVHRRAAGPAQANARGRPGAVHAQQGLHWVGRMGGDSSVPRRLCA